ncbi:hypothetical protein CEXT_378421 [Caerostris extrusa]|uniref:Uncharacterized protein n=1 Tax=Caerostris extrusa TaxID=172846 RepID=A0AAV4PJL2_CAEEX|nr:hypothetical protein CEXT_378421 [Caerostris extrusa]
MQPFSVGPVFSEEVSSLSLVTYRQWDTLWISFAQPALQQCGCVNSTILMQNNISPYIGRPVKKQVDIHFGNDNNYLPTARHLVTFSCEVILKMLCTELKNEHTATHSQHPH